MTDIPVKFLCLLIPKAYINVVNEEPQYFFNVNFRILERGVGVLLHF
jgi:hypothetical protein